MNDIFIWLDMNKDVSRWAFRTMTSQPKTEDKWKPVGHLKNLAWCVILKY